ncbi:MAG: hypothetical protein ACP5QT_08715, partial [Brevinematia bacterium]
SKPKDYLLDFSKDKAGTLSEKAENIGEKGDDLTQYFLGQAAGKIRARQQGGWLWFGSSCLVTSLASTFVHFFGFIPGSLIVAWSYNSTSLPPQDDFIGKDEKYIAGYKEGFQSEKKVINLINSSIGCCVGGTTGTLLWILLFAPKD